jgi:hypothetical protein
MEPFFQFTVLRLEVACTHAYIHTYVHTHIHTHTHTHIHTCMHAVCRKSEFHSHTLAKEDYENL